MILIVHVCILWYSHSVKVNYCFIVLGICYHFVKKETTMCGCIALCWTISVSNYINECYLSVGFVFNVTFVYIFLLYDTLIVQHSAIQPHIVVSFLTK